MAPKSKTPKRKGKLSTSFRKGKITPVNSGKKFKRQRKQIKRAISDSPFSVTQHLTPGKLSTPMTRPKKRRKVNKNNTPTVSKRNDVAYLNSEAVDTYYGIHNELNNEEIVLPSPVATLTEPMKAPILPPNRFLKESLADKFRNEHISMPVFGDDNVTVPVNVDSNDSLTEPINIAEESNEIIVIEDDEETPKDTSVVEEVGEEMLKLVSNQPIPSTPRTIVRQLTECNKDNTIILDDTPVDNEDDIEVIDNIPAIPLNSQNIQDVTRRYSGPAPDFIPLGGTQGRRNPPSYSQVAARNRRGRGKTRGAAQNIPRFIAGQTPNMNFAGVAPRLFRFEGNRRPAPRPSAAATTGPTMLASETDKKSGLRPIVIDGSNVAMSHGKHKEFSCRGIELVINYFKSRGHEKIVAFVPQFRSKPSMSTDKDLLDRLEGEGCVVFTPSREVEGRRIASHDDRFILDYSAQHGGVVVTRDNYREFVSEKDEYRQVITNRLLQPTFVGDDLMFPSDPLGRNGPNLDQFLKF